MKRLGFLMALVALAGCELVVDFDRSRLLDAGTDAATTEDGGIDDDGGINDDGGTEDAGPVDGGTEDGGIDDDGGTEDAGPVDGGIDAGPVDGGIDAGPVDGGIDAGPVDGGIDAGLDAGPLCSMASECDDGVACTVDACDFECSNTPDDAMCDDGDDCTAGSCDAVMGCEQTTLCSLTTGASITFSDLSTIAVLSEVEAVEDGFVAIHADSPVSPGDPGEVIGVAMVSAGTTADVSVELDREAVDGETLHAVLYVDSDMDMMFDVTMDMTEQLGAMNIIASFTAVVPLGTPAVEVSLGARGSSDFVFSDVRPSTMMFAEGEDPDLVFATDRRYRFVNNVVGAHPFEFVDATGSMVFLSQAVAGSLEGDGTISWDEVDANTIEFTTNAAFFAAVTAYRCSIHTGSMTGAVSEAP